MIQQGKMRLSSLLLSGVFATGLAQQAYHSDPAAACERLGSSFNAPHVTVNLAQYVPAGTNLSLPQQGTGDANCGNTAQVVPVDLCRITANVATSNRSEVYLEAWLPSNWTGRFLSTGNGGLGGCVQYSDLAYTVSYGFASVGANNGHNGTRGIPFLNNDDIVADFAYRSVHTGVVIGKELTKAYYQKEHTKSYYLGCSTGGRQGFKEAQDFPGDFDGIVAGAPALAFNNLSSWSGRGLLVTGPPTAPTFLTPQHWALVAADVQAQCDGLDGVKDGIIEDNDLCAYRPENLQCSASNGTNSTNCLTSPQVRTVRTLFTDFYGVNGSIIYSRMNYGTENIAAFIYYNGQPFPYTQDWYRYAIFNDPDWSAADLTLEDAAYAHKKNPFNIETWNGDLSGFQNKGGKILHYHGQTDGVITSDNSPRYYNHVSNTMQLRSSELDEFYRFFRVSGMNHCSGGVGAWGIGQNAALVKGAEQTPQNNVLLRIVDWVENGNAPETVTGYKYINVSLKDRGSSPLLCSDANSLFCRTRRAWAWNLSATTASTRLGTLALTRRTTRSLRRGSVFEGECWMRKKKCYEVFVYTKCMYVLHVLVPHTHV
jgi:feruloyl esterase